MEQKCNPFFSVFFIDYHFQKKMKNEKGLSEISAFPISGCLFVAPAVFTAQLMPGNPSSAVLSEGFPVEIACF